ncbi:GntR family transcriptional regulator [Leifsonia sp. fls2-241-R2A-40a]|uniref:GntR family transcriptional regulator n=1 Tax=Leifsonia sp. fls2-241-R2A-40a TaxID=3040290 RepID=UPI00254F244D|nr:GntR family transcriptional regulator [Leifsonia sp. fls2-241-R2A-40a]
MPLPSLDEPHDRRPRRLVRDRAYHSIRDAILDGSLRPGERLDDAQLQSWLGISRTPIRQALFALTLEGFIETAPQSHTRVVTPRPEDAAMLLQTVGVLVAGLTAVTLPALSSGQRQELGQRLRAALRAMDADDWDALVAHLREYYADLARLCPNRPLARLVDQSATALGYNVLLASPRSDIDWPTTRRQHEELARCLEEERHSDAELVTREVFGVTRIVRG